MKTDPHETEPQRPSSLAPGSPLRSCRLNPGGENVFAVEPDQLFTAWLAVADRQPRTERVAADAAARCSLHVQRTALFRFPDFIRAEVVLLGNDRCGLFIDSRSRYGLSDFGVNRRRVASWFSELRTDLNR
jgi:uncharacterized protein (DUF1499 family)